MTQKEWTEAERRAIANNPDLPEDVAAAFAEDLNEMADVSGVPNFSKTLGVPDGEGHPPAEPGSIQEMFPHLRDPRYVARQRVTEVIAKSERAGDTLLTKVLRPLFSLLPRETQLRLARATMNDMTAAAIHATEIWGEPGNVRVDGNECQVGTVRPDGDFVILGRGPSWEEAFADVDHGARMYPSSHGQG